MDTMWLREARRKGGRRVGKDDGIVLYLLGHAFSNIPALIRLGNELPGMVLLINPKP